MQNDDKDSDESIDLNKVQRDTHLSSSNVQNAISAVSPR